jgi:type II secretory pathway pseudopilin PulG
MNFSRHNGSGALRSTGGFTLAEVLAALLFMAIVIPVAVGGLRVANRAGQVGARKAAAARVAERVLNEQIVTGLWKSSAQTGTAKDGVFEYRWTVKAENWEKETLRLVTVQVTFTVQGEDYDLNLSTVADSTETTSTSATTTTQ